MKQKTPRFNEDPSGTPTQEELITSVIIIMMYPL